MGRFSCRLLGSFHKEHAQRSVVLTLYNTLIDLSPAPRYNINTVPKARKGTYL